MRLAQLRRQLALMRHPGDRIIAKLHGRRISSRNPWIGALAAGNGVFSWVVLRQPDSTQRPRWLWEFDLARTVNIN